MPQQLQNELPGETAVTINPVPDTEGVSHLTPAEEPVVHRQTVDALLSKLRRHTRLQKWFRVGAVVLGVQVAILWLLPYLTVYFPSLSPLIDYLGYVTPFVSEGDAADKEALAQLFNSPNPQNISVHRINLLYPLLLTIGCLASVWLARNQRRKASLTLAQAEDVRTVGSLAEALELGENRVSGEAAAALTNLLPHLKTTDGGLLNAQQRVCLRRALNGRHVGLSVAILKALEQVGDGNDLPVVERLADGKGRRAKDMRLKEAAQQCLPYLRARVATERASQTLLRPTFDPGAPAEVLLRPAQGASSVDPERLLRAGSPDEPASPSDRT